MKLLYEQSTESPLEFVSLSQIWDGRQSDQTGIALKPAILTSERYIVDEHFSKTGTFVHVLRNSDPSKILQVTTQDYFISSLKPYLSELEITFRFPESQEK